MRSVLLASLALLASATLCSAQSRLNEYRTEIIVTLPRVRGFGVLMLMDQRLGMSDLSVHETILGTGVISPQFHRMSVALEARHVKSGSGTVEQRYIPTFYFNLPLPAGFELRDRNRFEFRDVNGTWSRRYINRTAIGHNVAALHRMIFPYIQSDAVFDARSDSWTRLDGTVGVRTPLVGATSIDTFLTRSSDINRVPRVGVTLGALLRVPL
jgi:hypothetical protein